MNRRGPETKDFPIGLLNRNVCLEVSEVPDPFEEHVRQIDPQDRFKETQEEEVSYTHLWSLDQIKYNKRSNEVLFQRTLMMSLIARHCLICDRKRVGQQVLDFNAEETWNCPPMPIWSYWQSCKLTLGTLLSQPRPDIALYFERETIIDNDSWNLTPSATKRLVCYENADPLAGITRVFHFLTIEAKKAMTPINDLKAFYQSLNNASQALHNMYEFLKDAGPKHENDFFTKVRFFSVVASSEGLTIRIHRATEIAADAPDGRFIMPLRRDYTPQFEHRVFAKIIKDTEFNRETFLKNFQKRTSYAMLELHPLLQNAAVVLIKQLGTSTNDFLARSDSDFYRYGQTNYELQRSKVGSTRVHSPSIQRLMSIADWRQDLPEKSRNQTSVTDQSTRRGTATPTQGGQLGARNDFSRSRKRVREEVVIDNPLEPAKPAYSTNSRKKRRLP